MTVNIFTSPFFTLRKTKIVLKSKKFKEGRKVEEEREKKGRKRERIKEEREIERDR